MALNMSQSYTDSQPEQNNFTAALQLGMQDGSVKFWINQIIVDEQSSLDSMAEAYSFKEWLGVLLDPDMEMEEDDSKLLLKLRKLDINTLAELLAKYVYEQICWIVEDREQELGYLSNEIPFDVLSNFVYAVTRSLMFRNKLVTSETHFEKAVAGMYIAILHDNGSGDAEVIKRARKYALSYLHEILKIDKELSKDIVGLLKEIFYVGSNRDFEPPEDLEDEDYLE